MYKANGEMAPKVANPITVKDRDKLDIYQLSFSGQIWRIPSGDQSQAGAQENTEKS